MKKLLAIMSPLTLMILASAVLHTFLIFEVAFKAPEPKKHPDTEPALEVVLVNAKTREKPPKADALAQANLDRGGNTDKNKRMKTALPPPKVQTAEIAIRPEEEAQLSAKSAQVQSDAQKKQMRVKELEKEAHELMTQLKSKKKVETNPKQEAASPTPETGTKDSSQQKPSASELVASALDMARLEAQIAKQQEEYQKRPKRKYIGARTEEYKWATYVESWRQKVEKIGNLNYPEQAKAQKLYGKLRITVNIKSDGSLESVQINQSSGHKVLDDAAINIIKMSAPYTRFPDDLKKEVDILGITRTWTFTREDSLSSE